MATWGQTCQRFDVTAMGFETGFSRMRVRTWYAIAPHAIAYELVYQYSLGEIVMTTDNTCGYVNPYWNLNNW